MNFSGFRNKYIFTGELVVLNALHIGSGIEKDDCDAPFIEISEKEYYVPGSSFRGYLRTKLERLLDESNEIGLVEKKDRDRLNIADVKLIFGFTNLNKESEDCKENEKIKKRIYKKLGIEKNEEQKSLKSMAGRIHIADMPLLTEVDSIKRDGIKIDRDTGATENSAKFDYNVVPAGTKFEFKMELENVERYQLDLVCLALKDILTEDLFGGKLSRGIGKCRVDIKNIRYVNSIQDYIFKNDMEKIDCQDKIKEFMTPQELDLL